MKQLLLAFFSILLSLVTAKELSATGSDNLSAKFNSATQAYQNKDYNGAEKLFLELLKEEPQSPDILQNLGLIYYSLEDKGRALAYFRSLSNIEPRNITVYRTIDFIESKLPTKDFSNDRAFIEDLNLMLLRWIKLPELLIFYFLASLTFGIVYVKRLARKRKLFLNGEKISILTPEIYSSLIFIVILTSLTLLKISFENIETATIIAKNKLTLKSGPSENSADIYELFEGFEVNVESKFKDWAQITYQDQYTGWVKNSAIWEHLK